MNCKTAVGMLSAYLDRELAPQERDAVRMHIAQCDTCRTEERDLRSLKGLLLGIRAPEPAVDFEQRLISSLRDEDLMPVRRRLTLPRFRPIVWGQLGGLAAAGFMAAFVVFRTSHSIDVSPRPEPKEAIASNFDVDPYAEGDMAYTVADDYTAGSPLVTATSHAP